MEHLLIMLALALLNGGYIYLLHRGLRRLDEANKVQAAANRRLVGTALDVCSELSKLTADLKQQETAASDKREKLNRLMTLIIKDYYGDLAVSKRNGNGRGKGQTAEVKPTHGALHERPGVQLY